jgi:hypothetical protein
LGKLVRIYLKNEIKTKRLGVHSSSGRVLA